MTMTETKTSLDIAREIIYSLGVQVNQVDLERFASILNRKEFKKKEMILRDGEICRDYMYVEKGMVRQFYYKNGHDVTEHFDAEGDILMCIESLYKKEPTHLLIEALEPCVLHFINFEKLVALTEDSKELATWLRLFMQNDLVISQRKADAFRFESSKERYERFLQDYPQAARRASVNDIASYLLMTPETLSRIRGGNI